MRQFGSFRTWALLLAVAAAVVVCAAPQFTWAQDAAAGAAPAAPPQSALDKLIHFVDYALIGLILFLSVIGMTLIFGGFLRNRESVFMPPATTETIRNMIQAKQFKELMD